MDQDAFAFVIGLIIGVIIGIACMAGIARYEWHREAIQQGYAHYHATTGEWQWNNATNTAEKP